MNLKEHPKISHITKLIKKMTLIISIAALCSAIIAMPRASSQGAANGLRYCVNILVPSLFPFMALSSFTVKSGIAESLGVLIAPAIERLFGLPGCAGTVILLGLVGGYPTGAIGVAGLYNEKKLTQKQAEQMLMFTVGAGPAFVMSAIGSQISSNSTVGAILFVAQVLSSVALGIILGLFSNNKLNNDHIHWCHANKSLAHALVQACQESSSAMLNMCTFVILFSALFGILDQIHLTSSFADLLTQIGTQGSIAQCILPALLEVTNGCLSIIKNRAPTELIAFALGWAGCCVHFQIFSIAESIPFSKLKFMAFRLIHGVISAAITHILFIVLAPHLQFSNTFRAVTHSGTFEFTLSKGSIALILLCTYFLSALTSQKTVITAAQGSKTIPRRRKIFVKLKRN